VRRAYAESAVLIALAASAAWGALALPAALPGETWAGLVPLLAAIALALVGAMIAFAPEPGAADDSARGPGIRNAALMLVLALAYHQATGWVGYLLATAGAAPLIFALFGIRRIGALAAAAALCPLALYLVFFKGLNIFLQRGAWFDLLDLFS